MGEARRGSTEVTKERPGRDSHIHMGEELEELKGPEGLGRGYEVEERYVK